jgi:hypothetical protein
MRYHQIVESVNPTVTNESSSGVVDVSREVANQIFETLGDIEYFLPGRTLLNHAQKVFNAKYPGVKLYMFQEMEDFNYKITTDPEGKAAYFGYANAQQADGTANFSLTFGASILYDDTSGTNEVHLTIGVLDATSGSYPGVVSDIFNSVFKAMPKKLSKIKGLAFARVLTVEDDRSYGIWQAVAKKCDAFYDNHD